MEKNKFEDNLGCLNYLIGIIGILLYIISIYLCFYTIPSQWLLSVFVAVSLFLIIVSFTNLDSDDISDIEYNFVEIIKAKFSKFFSLDYYFFYIMLVILFANLTGLYSEGYFDQFGEWQESYSNETQLKILGGVLIITPFSYWISLLKSEIKHIQQDYKTLIGRVLREERLNEEMKEFYEKEFDKI